MFFFAIVGNLFSEGQPDIGYYVENLSNEDLYFTLIRRHKLNKYCEIEYRDDDNNIITINIGGPGDGRPAERIKSHIIPGPYKEGWMPVLMGIQWPSVRVNDKYFDDRVLSAAAIISMVLDVFVIYDANDNVIMTLDDLDENSFRGNYRRVVMTLTEEMVHEGREKYAGTAINGRTDVRNLFVPGEINVEITPSEFMIRIENQQGIQPAPDYTFTDEEGNFQLQYTFFRQTENDVDNIRMLYLEFVHLIYHGMRVQRRENILIRSQDYVAQKDYNGDCGHYIHDNVRYLIPDLSDRFEYAEMNFYYKHNEGIVMQTLLYNPRSYINEKIKEIYRTFGFLD